MAVRTTLVEVTARAAYVAATPDVDLGFEPSEHLLQAEGTSTGGTVYVSFDGVNDHLTLQRGQLSQSLTVAIRSKRVWTRGVPGAGTLFARITSIRQS